MQHQGSKRNRLTMFIGIALVLGIITGFILNKNYVGEENSRIMNADVQQAYLNGKISALKKPSDSVQYNLLSGIKNGFEKTRLSLEKKILDEKSTSNVSQLVIIDDTIKRLNSQMTSLL